MRHLSEYLHSSNDPTATAFGASINGWKTSLMKLPPPQSGHSNRAFDLLAEWKRPHG
jgi:hypothetical protein